ncbi:MAG: hypothetical protein L3K14_04845 [Thermoplasmata archaeon]|nr:hypothetical protein [Thermoplasmata archaeon]
MTDWVTIAEVAAPSWVLAIAALVGVFIERKNRKADEDNLRKVGEAVIELKGVVASVSAAVLELQAIRGIVLKGVDLAKQANTLKTIDTLLRGIDFLDRFFG